MAGIRVYLEVAPKRAFACAVDWPGWCRSGRGPDAALEALAAYRPRYLPVAAWAHQRVPAGGFDVVEELTGDATTEFGAPGAIPSSDGSAWAKGELHRHVALLEAAWATLDNVVSSAPAVLRKGPRGGGRDRDAIYAHVLAAEDAYARKIGVRVRLTAAGAASVAARRAAGTVTAAGAATVAARRAAFTEALLRGPGAEPWKWPPRYAIRRTAWHAVDHAWEIEDRREQ